MPDVTLAIVNFNGRRYLEDLLSSLFRQTYRDFVVHVVDDASTDDGQAYVEREWPEARWLGAAENRGITATMARAVATRRDGAGGGAQQRPRAGRAVAGGARGRAARAARRGRRGGQDARVLAPHAHRRHGRPAAPQRLPGPPRAGAARRRPLRRAARDLRRLGDRVAVPARGVRGRRALRRGLRRLLRGRRLGLPRAAARLVGVVRADRGRVPQGVGLGGARAGPVHLADRPQPDADAGQGHAVAAGAAVGSADRPLPAPVGAALLAGGDRPPLPAGAARRRCGSFRAFCASAARCSGRGRRRSPSWPACSTRPRPRRRTTGRRGTPCCGRGWPGRGRATCPGAGGTRR